MSHGFANTYFILQFIHIYRTRHYRKLGIPSHQEPAQLLLVLKAAGPVASVSTQVLGMAIPLSTGCTKPLLGLQKTETEVVLAKEGQGIPTQVPAQSKHWEVT